MCCFTCIYTFINELLRSTASTAAPVAIIVLIPLLVYLNCAHVLRFIAWKARRVHPLLVALVGTHGPRIIGFNTLLLEILDDIESYMFKNLVDIYSSFRTSFEECQAVLISKSLPSTRINFLLALWHISFIGDQHLSDIGQCMLVNLAKPVCDVVECIFFSTVVDQKYAHCTFVVSLGYGSEPFLASCIPNL